MQSHTYSHRIFWVAVICGGLWSNPELKITRLLYEDQILELYLNVRKLVVWVGVFFFNSKGNEMWDQFGQRGL